MKSYGQFCPIAKAAELFCERWTALILRDLGFGTARRELLSCAFQTLVSKSTSTSRRPYST